MQTERYFKGIWPLLWLAVLGFLLYGQTIGYDYTYLDDHEIVLGQMEKLQKVSTIPHAFTEDVFHNPGEKAFYYRPMLTISFALDAMVGGGKFLWFHIGNILLHILAAWTLFLLLTELQYDRMKSFLFALLFLAHPVLVHAVAWVPGRNDSLLAVFLFPSMLFFLRYMRTRNATDLFLHLLFFLLSLFSKETAVAIPVVSAAYVILILKRYDNRLVWPVAFWVVLTAAFLWLRYNILGGSHGYPISDSLLSILHNLKALLPFTGKSVVPAGLSVFPIMKDMQVATFAGIGVIILLTVLLFTTKEKRWGYFLFAITWFLLFLIPSFIKSKSQEPDFTEHRIYVSIAGLIIFLLETGPIRNTDWRRKEFWIPFLAVLVLFGILTVRHSRHYENRVAFWKNAVETSPSHAFNYNNLGAMYFLDNNLEEAEKYFRKAIEINPVEPLANGNIGLVCMNTNRPQEAERFYLREIEINATYDNVYFNLGILYFKNGLVEPAAGLWEKLLTLNPYYTGAYYNLIVAYTQLNRPGDVDRIKRMAAERGIRLDP